MSTGLNSVVDTKLQLLGVSPITNTRKDLQETPRRLRTPPLVQIIKVVGEAAHEKT